MSADDANNKIESLRKELLGPETTDYQLIKKIIASEDLLSYLELEYHKDRREMSSISPIWYDRNAIVSSVATLAVVLVIGISIGVYYNMDYSIIKLALPLSVGLGIVPFVIFAARNNYVFQQKNSVLSSRLSEMMNLRSKITLLQEKQLKLTPILDQPDVKPLEVRHEIISWLKQTLSYLNAITEIPEFDSIKFADEKIKATPIIRNANDEYSLPKWRFLPEELRIQFEDADLDFIHDEYFRIISNPDYVYRSQIANLKQKIEDVLSKYEF